MLTAPAPPLGEAARAQLREAVLHGALWWVAATAIALCIADGGLTAASPVDYVYAVGRMAGLVAAVLVMNQVLLISRVPWIERTLGHDRAAAMHARMGKIAFLAMLTHAGLILVMMAHYDGRSVLAEIPALWDFGWFMVAAQAALGLFALVVVTSLLIVRRRWRYETWHAVHLAVYAAIALAIPHQFLQGSTFSTGGFAWWFWLALYVVAFGSWLTYRVMRPLVYARRHRLVVADVTRNGDGSATITVAGKDLWLLGARAGQFGLWRFLAKGRWREAHPFSLSSAPAATLRITVKPVGDFSAALADVPVGTRVLFEGPLGAFTAAARTRDGVVYAAAGIGVTPVRAMLEEAHEGPVDVILRARSQDASPLRDEVHALAAQRGATVHEFFGPRGDGWSSAAEPTRIAALVPDIVRRDVFICGPASWADAVEADAIAAGVPRWAIHRERFGWS